MGSCVVSEMVDKSASTRRAKWKMLTEIKRQKQLAEPVTQPGMTGYLGGSDRLAVLLE
jgi:hypothetical protein